MRHRSLNWTLGSTVLLSLAVLFILSPNLVSSTEASSALEGLKSSSLYWKRDSLLHSRFIQNGNSLRKRSLYSHVNDDIVPSPPTRLPVVNRRPPLIDLTRPHRPSPPAVVENEDKAVKVTLEVTHEGSREGVVQAKPKVNIGNNKNDKISEAEKFKLWDDNHNNDDEDDDEVESKERRTMIEPHYPSIDLFDEEELLEVGEDGILRSSSRPKEEEDQDSRHDQVWLVDEWEEELEGDMDEWMDWVEDGLGSYQDNESTKDKNRMRDQSAMDSLVFDEDEASPFQRLFSDSWLF
ncbi:hypothetical protein FBU30_002886 [Linnemannia zychae]|nr:hypothetical protein FBU30_002886 [Linnemannia zychae]